MCVDEMWVVFFLQLGAKGERMSPPPPNAVLNDISHGSFANMFRKFLAPVVEAEGLAPPEPGRPGHPEEGPPTGPSGRSGRWQGGDLAIAVLGAAVLLLLIVVIMLMRSKSRVK